MVKKYGLALEGGGARGAYEAGALKLLNERGYKFSIACGTSIGSINAAMVASGEIERLYDLWKALSYSDIFDIDEKKIEMAFNKQVSGVKYLSGFAKNTVKDKGIDTSKIRNFLLDKVDEKKIRKSKCDFGIVTISLSDKKGREIYKEEMEEGMLLDYVLASSRLPIFKQELLNGKYYTDGGMYNNCPVDMIVNKGVKDIIVVRVGSLLATKDEKKLFKRNDLNITLIEPNHELPSILAFDNKTCNYLLKLGYFDAIKRLDGLIGYKYYIKPYEEELAFDAISNIDYNALNYIYSLLKLKNVKDTKKIYLEVVIPMLLKKIGRDNLSTYTQAMLALVEYAAEKLKIDEFEVFDIKDIIYKIKEKIEDDESAKKRTKVDEIIFTIFKNMEV
ncbi:MAG: patatin-like phospholipase family protein [Clostridia bacterium]|nr:patatin-like phospholipase family protein [Clostridia bacterium]